MGCTGCLVDAQGFQNSGEGCCLGGKEQALKGDVYSIYYLIFLEMSYRHGLLQIPSSLIGNASLRRSRGGHFVDCRREYLGDWQGGYLAGYRGGTIRLEQRSQQRILTQNILRTYTIRISRIFGRLFS